MIEGRYVTDEKDLYDLRAQKDIKTAEITIPRAQIKEMENYVPWHNTYLALYFTLTGLHALHILGGSIVIGYLWGPGRRMWKTDRSGSPIASRFRAFLAFRGSGLDFPISCLIFDVT